MKKALAIIAAVLLGAVATAQPYGVRYVSPDVQGNSVTFRLKADNATYVRVYGDFLPGIDAYNLGGNEAMTRQENGMWEYTATNLAPDFYFYYFEVDGVRMLDPATVIVARNYVDYCNTFMIKGDELLTGGNSVPDFVHNIVPYVESHFKVKTDKAHRAIAGVSMGSMYTFTIVDRNPGMFDYVGFIGAPGRSNDMETRIWDSKAQRQ